ncbi:uncharacterized protein Tco025E_08128 [Trypanosoma conorhini]|uniref:Uncharacterized protein n=1 Tax=Trypanosoma conorhini TaxID=83891 RepID=A0A3R7MDD2_9TRYP|nr:uncharacterized protein Tco025E_08128 [Trypanosoma conorhini]RNF03726.1 hypothetical protein Tco025E_08128 [Trypanosoma conorhini]
MRDALRWRSCFPGPFSRGARCASRRSRTQRGRGGGGPGVERHWRGCQEEVECLAPRSGSRREASETHGDIQLPRPPWRTVPTDQGRRLCSGHGHGHGHDAGPKPFRGQQGRWWCGSNDRAVGLHTLSAAVGEETGRVSRLLFGPCHELSSLPALHKMLSLQRPCINFLERS